jgi:hypothetical protein
MRSTDFAKLAAARPVNRQAAEVAALAPQGDRPWSGVILELREQLAVAEREAQRLRQALAALGYPTPLTTRHEANHRHRLTRQLEHYEAVALELERELCRAHRAANSRPQPKRQAPRWRKARYAAPGAATAAPGAVPPPSSPAGPPGPEAAQAAPRKGGPA